jgi:hypothetical protein
VTLWATRDVPVLRHLAEHPPRDGVLFTETRSDQPREGLPGVTEAAFDEAVTTLADADYVAWEHRETEGGGGRIYTNFQVTGAGKQALGLWPRFDALGSPGELAAVLEALALDAATEEERTNLKRAADAVRHAGPELLRSLATGVLGSLARSQLGI